MKQVYGTITPYIAANQGINNVPIITLYNKIIIIILYIYRALYT